MSFLQTTDRCAVFGARGMAGRAISRALTRQNYKYQLLPSRQELDLLDCSAVYQWMQQQRPDVVVLAAAKVEEFKPIMTNPRLFFWIISRSRP